MTEFITPPELQRDAIERNSMLIAYIGEVVTSAGLPHFRDVLSTATETVNYGSHWNGSTSITQEERESVAGSSVLKQLARSLGLNRDIFLEPEVDRALNVYLEVQDSVDEHQVSTHFSNWDRGLVSETIQVLRGTRQVGVNTSIQVAKHVWDQRGMVDITLQQVDDAVKNIADMSSLSSREGNLDPDLITPAQMPEYRVIRKTANRDSEDQKLSTFEELWTADTFTAQVPWYRSFYDPVDHGTAWITSLTEDIAIISKELKT